PGHLGCGPAFVDEDQALGVEAGLAIEPVLPAPGHVRALLLARVRRLFFSVIRCRTKKRCTVLGATCVPCSRPSITASSTSVMSLVASHAGARCDSGASKARCL